MRYLQRSKQQATSPASMGFGADDERVGLNFEIDSPQITPERKAEAIVGRDAVMIEWADTKLGIEWSIPSTVRELE